MPLPNIEILEELHKTHSFRAIARMYGCHHSWIAYKMRDVDTSKPDLSERDEKIKSMYAAGVPVNVIARWFGRSEKTIYRICAGKVKRRWTKKI